jgi:hypothetical protein
MKLLALDLSPSKMACGFPPSLLLPPPPPLGPICPKMAPGQPDGLPGGLPGGPSGPDPPDPPGSPLPGPKNECTFPGFVFARVRAAAAVTVGMVCVAIERL